MAEKQYPRGFPRGMVEVTRLELAASRSLTVRATKLRHTSSSYNIVAHRFDKIKRFAENFSTFFLICLPLRLRYDTLLLTEGFRSTLPNKKTEVFS